VFFTDSVSELYGQKLSFIEAVSDIQKLIKVWTDSYTHRYHGNFKIRKLDYIYLWLYLFTLKTTIQDVLMSAEAVVKIDLNLGVNDGIVG
jgi:hypothetical protein